MTSNAQAKRGQLTNREINADLEAMRVDFNPSDRKDARLKQRNAARAAR